MLNLQFAETMELTEAELEIVYGGNLGIMLLSQPVLGEGSGHLGQSLISGRKILTIDLTLILTAVVINIKALAFSWVGAVFIS